jgi:RHS repeat-associated protein
LRFSTKYQDDETSAHCYGHRYYDPNTGRWLNQDPIQERGGFNLYGFVGNNPANFIDLLGFAALIYPNGFIGPLPPGGMYQATADWIQQAEGNGIEEDSWGYMLIPGGGLYMTYAGSAAPAAEVVLAVKVVDKCPKRNLLYVLKYRLRQLILGTDPRRGFIQAEGTAGARLEQALGRTISRSEDVSADLVDSQLGRISVKGPIPAKGSLDGLAKAVIKDAMGGNTATQTVVVDTLGLSPTQISALKTAIQAGTQGTVKKIIFLQ